MLRGFEQRHLILIESDWLVTAGINNRFVKVYSLIAILLVATKKDGRQGRLKDDRFVDGKLLLIEEG